MNSENRNKYYFSKDSSRSRFNEDEKLFGGSSISRISPNKDYYYSYLLIF